MESNLITSVLQEIDRHYTRPHQQLRPDYAKVLFCVLFSCKKEKQAYGTKTVIKDKKAHWDAGSPRVKRVKEKNGTNLMKPPSVMSLGYR